jgi:alpha-1,6-mannosyltransferase
LTIVDRRARTGLVTSRWLGFLGSVLIVLGGVVVGVGPSGAVPPVPSAGAAIMWWTAAVHLGMTLLALAWYRLGRSLPPVRDQLGTGLLWAAPFLLSGPIFSRDVYSYLAQGAMTAAGLDPYRFGPSAFGGELAADVPPIWQDTPAPYGPVFLSLAGAVTGVTGHEVWPGLVGMRLLAVAGIALIAYTVPRIAGDHGADPATAVWLAVLNPLVLLHLVADAHNEAVMIGLMCAGLLLALRGRHLPAVVLITLAGLVKGPALAGLAFLVVFRAGRLTGRARLLRAAAGTVVAAAGTAAVVTVLTGTGFGWIPALRTPTRALTWMSVTTDAGSLLGRALHGLGLAGVSQTRQVVWSAGLLAAAVICLVLLRRSVTLGIVPALGLSLIVVVVLGPAVHIWYLLWGLIPLAAAVPDRIRRMAVPATFALLVVSAPNGPPHEAPLVAGAFLGISAGLLAYGVLRGTREALRPVLE